MANLAHYNGSWINAVKAEIAVTPTTRFRRDSLLKRRVRRSRSRAVNPKDLVLFVGQGVKHPTFGYGAVRSVDSGTVSVKFRTGVETVPTSSLGTAAFPVVDALAARRAKCFPYPTMKAKKAAEAAERRAARAAKNFPYPTAKAKKAAQREARRVTRPVNVTGQSSPFLQEFLNHLKTQELQIPELVLGQ